MKSLRCCRCQSLLDEVVCAACYQAIVDAKNSVVRESYEYKSKLQEAEAIIRKLMRQGVEDK